MMVNDLPIRQLTLNITPSKFSIQEVNHDENIQIGKSWSGTEEEFFYFGVQDGILTFNSAFFGWVCGELERSTEFRKIFCGPNQSCENVQVFLVPPSRQFVDFPGNAIVNWYMRERQGLEYVLSWMSTLGGAFSSLGDASDAFAEKAGRTSWRQLMVAERLGDSELAVRCRLYASLSLIQRGYLHDAKIILRREYDAACKENKDIRLKRMCLGIWAKMKFASMNLPHKMRKRLEPVTKNISNEIKTDLKS